MVHEGLEHGLRQALELCVEPNLRAIGCRDVSVTARLLVAMISETAILEFEAGARSPAARRSLRRLVELAAA